jgi:hypothetical protein
VRQVNHRAVLVVNHLSVREHRSLPLTAVLVVLVASSVLVLVVREALHLLAHWVRPM